MSTRRLSLIAAVAYALAGPLLAVGLWTPAGPVVVAAVLLLWGGTGGVLAALLLVARDQQRALRKLQRTLATTAEGMRANPPGVSHAELTAGLTELREALTAGQDATTRELVRHLDTRVLGLHAVARELAGHDPVAGSAPAAREDRG